ncbi:MAG: NAD(P)/FAD-dependent oxidoreductase [Bacteroidota bacterium]
MVNIPPSDKKRVVIAGCGFAGLKLARSLKNSGYQVIIIDKYNYHQFQPLFYQVATAGLEPSSISFPLRKIFHHFRDFYIRIAEIQRIDPDTSQLWTTSGIIRYDLLVLANGAGNYFIGLKNLEKLSMPMKSVSEALSLRNALLKNFEDALAVGSDIERERFMNLVIVGSGPSGVEISGALADMRKYVLPKDYFELDPSKINIHLIEAGGKVLPSMSERSSAKAKEFLEKLGVKVHLNTQVKDYNGKEVFMADGSAIKSNLVIWTAGIRGVRIPGLADKCYLSNNRVLVDPYNKVIGYDKIYAIGDLSAMISGDFPRGHPQVAPVALQQAANLGSNLKKRLRNEQQDSFRYRDQGTMATVGRNLAVVDLPYVHFHGTFAWFVWMFVHLMSILTIKNRILVFYNWFWNYFTYDQSLRLILKPEEDHETTS